MSETVTPVWIDPSWLSWGSIWETKEPISNDDTARLYEIHQHACDRLAGDPNEFDRVDSIMALRRVVGRRVKALKEIYKLRELPTGTKPRHDLELLEYFGIIRPFMLKRLIDIRNIVEHQDSSPPSVDECLMYADLIWYFLRSTDGLAQMQAETLIIKPRDVPRSTEPMVMLHFREPFSEMPDIETWVKAAIISYQPRIDWIKIESTEVTLDESPKVTWVRVSGKIRGTEKQMKPIYDIYFKTCH
ncbi:MAG TPA: hypothetical protein VGR71_17590 [Nitrospira sp.]|nr:hypothetical protein [Nitrospira sp.]